MNCKLKKTICFLKEQLLILLHRIFGVLKRLCRRLLEAVKVFFTFFFQIDHLIITLLSCGLAVLLIIVPANFSLFNPFKEALRSFRLTDVYYAVNNVSGQEVFDTDIILVDIGDLDRPGLARLIDDISFYEPSVIALDIIFPRPKSPGEDSLLLSTLQRTENIVYASDIQGYDKYRNTYTLQSGSFFQNERTLVGFTNLYGYGNEVVREFVPYVFVDAEKTYSLAVETARKYSSAAFDALVVRGNERELIDFKKRGFLKVYNDELDNWGEYIRGKIVLVGSLHDAGDLHMIPAQNNVSGMEIHAYIISTIINGSYIDQAGTGTQFLITFLITYFSCVVFGFIFLKFPVFNAVIIRLIQLMILILTVWAGLLIYVNKDINISFVYPMLVIALAEDIFIFYVAAIKYINKSKPLRSIYLAAK